MIEGLRKNCQWRWKDQRVRVLIFMLGRNHMEKEKLLYMGRDCNQNSIRRRKTCFSYPYWIWSVRIWWKELVYDFLISGTCLGRKWTLPSHICRYCCMHEISSKYWLVCKSDSVELRFICVVMGFSFRVNWICFIFVSLTCGLQLCNHGDG
jgi:hypothetical protein